MLITVGLIGIYLQIKTEEFASILTGGVANSSSGVMAMASGAMAGLAVGSNIGGVAKSVGAYTGGRAKAAYTGAQGVYSKLKATNAQNKDH
jgi:hypothetical protein